MLKIILFRPISLRMMDLKTIAAIATPPGFGGVGVVRISGSLAKEVLKSLWITNKVPVDNFASHRLYLGNFMDPFSQKALDRGLAVWMKGPHSYTGEDVVEIHSHGSPMVLEKILQACLHAGASLASPGEFTKRAFLNGKMDLSQAEAVADLIGASSERGLQLAKEHFQGRLSETVRKFQEDLVHLRAFVEASIDFPEEDIDFIQKEGVLDRLIPIRLAITELLQTYVEGKLHREGVKTVLVGRPNVGKSSLMNALLGVKRVIVHHLPGTTRDVVVEGCQIGPYIFQLFDTAGLRSTKDEVEALGVQRSEELLKEADLILWVLDGAESLQQEDIDFLSTLDLGKTFICVNKVDKSLAWDPNTLILEKEKKQVVLISAREGLGLTGLQEKMVGWVRQLIPNENVGLSITKLRHKQILERTLEALDLSQKALEGKNPSELIAYHLRKAHECLGEMTGANVTDDLLDTIFKEFCIGK